MTDVRLPLTPAPASVSLRSQQRTKSSQAASGRIVSRSYGGQIFTLKLVYPPMTRAQFAPIHAFVTAQGGRNGIFEVRVPDDLSGETGERVGNLARYDDDWKLRMITGTDPLTLYPVPENPTDSLQTSGLYMRCSLAADVQEVKLSHRNLFRFELDLVERL